MPVKSLDIKIDKILADPNCGEFIIADAKDADMASGMVSMGRDPEQIKNNGPYRSVQRYHELIRENVHQGLVDIMLMSGSTNHTLTIQERLFDNSPVTPAVRANDTTDIWWPLHGNYATQPSRPFRSATLDHALYGRLDWQAGDEPVGADLGLYSITFNNDLDRDMATLQAYRDFRLEAETKGFRHFLEVFDPNALQSPIDDLPRFMNDSIARVLAGVAQPSRPLFLKIVYHGPAAMEQLVAYDSRMIVGILGGASGTTFDAFYQLWEARKYGARVALYGRMINNSEHQPTFIQHLRWLADGDLNDPADAVRSYHGALDKLAIKPLRSLDQDLEQTLSFT